MEDTQEALVTDTVVALILQADGHSVRQIALGMHTSQRRVRALLSGPPNEATAKIVALCLEELGRADVEPSTVLCSGGHGEPWEPVRGTGAVGMRALLQALLRRYGVGDAQATG